MKLLGNHHLSPETAYVVADYPYGGLRCRKRYWLEVHRARGVRVVTQTTDPRKQHIWNKPRASIYHRCGGALYLDDLGHVEFAGLAEYSTGAEAMAWRDKFGPAVPEAAREQLDSWITAQLRYEAATRRASV